MLQRARDEAQYGRYRAYAMRAARGDIDWAEALVMAVSVLCAVAPACRFWWLERKKKIKAKENAKEGIARSKRDVESRMKEQRSREEEIERRRAAQPRSADSSDDEDAGADGDSDDRRREKEARRARVKKARVALRGVMKQYATAEDEEKAEAPPGEETVEAEDVELVVKELSLDELDELLATMDAAQRECGGDVAQLRRRTLTLFRSKVSAPRLRRACGHHALHIR